MMARAVEQQWPMTPEKRASVMQELLDIVHSGDCSPRDRVSAARALLAADKQSTASHVIREVESPGDNHLHVHLESDSLEEKKKLAAELLSRLGVSVVGST